MAYINLPRKKTRKEYKTYAKKNNRDNLNHKAVYNTNQWRYIRIEKLMNNPLCENCLKNDKIELAIEVHHIKPISNGKNIVEKQILGFDYKNLISLCVNCHKDEHKKTYIEND